MEDLGAIVGADNPFAKVGPVDLEEELKDAPGRRSARDRR
jgi:hypothetical protein